ncbi:response regulator transcription factor [Dermatobacter hominis]|uniref:response regulator transcription factor n=1 Tax=Dermatobacter hominis TaxID=2884263 RepID=UPI001D10051D|nr:helix-turn-helix transcriptional regulator [Dermatobacter hominis]UDY37636.1 helix-turn-helix transcriptional regulator [Dermatobacter hominis]
MERDVTTDEATPGWFGQDCGLSERESQIVALAAEGATNREIAQRLIIGTETVKTHLHMAFGKLGVRNRVEAAAAYHRSMASSIDLT